MSKAFQWYVACHLNASKSGWFMTFNDWESNWHLIPNPSFSHNLCFNYSNEPCKLILDIYVSKAFQWYKKIFNLMNFDTWNCSLKNQESIGTPTPKIGVHLGMCGSFLDTLPHIFGNANVTLELHSWPTPFHVFALVTSPRLGSWHFWMV